jgi:hypothetical protein
MSTYAKDPLTESPSGFVTQEISNIELGKPAPKDITSVTERLSSAQRSKPLPERKDPIARATEQKHVYGLISEKIKRSKRTQKHKPADKLSKEKRREEIAARRAEAMRSKNWLAQMSDIEYEGLFNGKFGLNKETKESMEKVFSETMDKFKDVANNNNVVLKHIFGLENAGTVLSMLASIVIAFIGVRMVGNFGDFFGFVLKFVMGVAFFRVSHGFVASMFDSMCEEELDDFEMGLSLDVIEEQIKACEDAGAKAPKKLYARRDFLRANPDKNPQPQEEREELEHEGLMDKPLAFTHLLGGFVNTALGVGIGFLLSGAQKGALKKLINDHKLLSDARSLLSEVMGWIAKTFDGIFGTSFSKHYSKNGKLEKWGSDVAALYEEFAGGKLTDATQGAKRVYQLRMRAIELKKDMSMTASAASYMQMMMQLITTMENYYGHQGVSPTDRMEPVVVCFKGASGIGKSTITPAFIDAVLCKSVLTKEQVSEYMTNKDSQLYQLLPEEDHVNGYNGQEAVVIEDMGQFLTQKGQKDDMFPIIRFKNTAPCRLNAASLEKKGVLTFTSSLIVCNTNLEQFYPPSILSPEAFLRRFDFWIKLVPRKEYSTDKTKELGPEKRRLDREKCNGVLDTEACEYHLEYIPNFEHPTFTTREIVNWDTLINKVCELVKKQKERHASLNQARNDRIKKIIEEMEAEAKAKVEQDNVERKDATEIKHEGLFYPFRKAANIVGIGRRRSLIDRAKATTSMLAKWFSDITKSFIRVLRLEQQEKWIRRALMLVLVFVGVALTFKFIGWLCGLLPFIGRKRKDELSFTDPAEFFEYTHQQACAAYGFAAPPERPTRKVRKRLVKAWREDMDVQKYAKAFGATLKCKPEELDKFVADYEAQLFDQPDHKDLPFHVKLAKSISGRNQWHMYEPDEDIDFDMKVSGGILTMICGRTAMLNAHFIRWFRERFAEQPDAEILLVQHGNVRRQVRVPIAAFADDANLVMDRDRDVAFVRFGKYMPVCRDIRRFFASEEATRQNRDFETALIALRTPRMVERMELRKRTTSGVVYAKDGSVHNQIFTYYADTINGDCGSMIMYTGDYAKHTERIIGIHMGGNNDGPTKRGFASILTREVLDKMLLEFEPEPRLGELEVTEETGLLDEETSHVVTRTVDKPVFQSMKTCIKKSAIHGMLEEPSKRPAILSKKALNKALKKQDALNVTLNEDDLEACADHAFESLNKCIKHRGRKLTFEEAIVGLPELKSFRKIDRSTSVGWPLCHDPEIFDGKRSMLGYGEEYDLNNPKLLEIRRKVEASIARLENGEVPDVVFMDMMKDENRPNESVDAMKTRLIAACPFEWTIIYRMYYGAVCNDIIEGRIDNECCVGINPLGKEWDYLSRTLKKYGQHVVAGDFSSFDNSQTCQAIEATMGVMNRLTGHTGERDQMVLAGLSVTISQAQHIVGNKIFENTHGMPSGNPMTTIINCIFGMIMFRMAWLRLMKPEYNSRREALRGFKSNVELKMYGDDNIQNISKWAIKRYNQRTLMMVFPELGLGYTSDKKDDLDPPAWRLLDLCTFLKRGFRFDDPLQRWVAPLDQKTIFSMLDWTKKGASADSITLDNCENACREWVLHGKQYYDVQAQRLQAVVDEVFGAGAFTAMSYKAALEDSVQHVPEWVALHT